MWLANQTRPDIANAVRAVARYTNQLRGVYRSTAIGITFQKGSGLELVAFADADYASKAEDRS